MKTKKSGLDLVSLADDDLHAPLLAEWATGPSPCIVSTNDGSNQKPAKSVQKRIRQPRDRKSTSEQKSLSSIPSLPSTQLRMRPEGSYSSNGIPTSFKARQRKTRSIPLDR
jgi:hypothetical protein